MYNTSDNYKEKILLNSTTHILKIYIDGEEIASNNIFEFKQNIELFANKELCLGSTPEIDIEFKIYKNLLPSTYNEVYIESGIKGEIIPIGHFIIQKPIKYDDFTVTIKAVDYMKKFENIKYDGSDLTYPATMKQVLQDICTKIGVELGSTSFINMDKQISVYDNTVSARTYIGYIAEQASGFATIGKDGKLYIKSLGQDIINFNINLFKDYKWGDKFKISKVSYEDGIQDYKIGDNTSDTLYINSNNIYIVDKQQIQNIYNKIKNFEAYSFEGETIIDPAYDIGDILIIDNKPIIYQGNLEFAGKFKANIKSTIAPKTSEESMQTKQSSSTKFRKVQSQIDQENAKITQLVSEIGDRTQKTTTITEDITGLQSNVSDIEDITNDINGTTTISLANAVAGPLLELHIKGNNSVFKYLYPSNTLCPSNILYPYGDSRIEVTDADNNTITYELGVLDTLRQNGEIKDEYVLEKSHAKIIRRINEDGTVKVNETVEDLGEFTIKLSNGTNKIKIQNYEANISAKWAIKNNFTDVFATQVNMNSKFTETATGFTTIVEKKVDKDSIASEINQSAEAVKIKASKIDINGAVTANENFKVNLDGSVETKALYLQDGGKVIGGDGMLTNLYFESVGTLSGFNLLGFQTDNNNNFQKGDIALNINIPENFIVKSAILTLRTIPGYWELYTTDGSWTGWGYSRNLKLYYGSNMPQFYMGWFSEYYIDYNTLDKNEIVNAFGSATYTPTITSGNSIETKQSIDIKDYIAKSGHQTLIVETTDSASGSSSNFETEKAMAQKTGTAKAYINIVGYMNYKKEELNNEQN